MSARKTSQKSKTPPALRKDVSTDHALVGRVEEMRQIRACLAASRNVLLEGPVGVGKTHLALAVARDLGRKTFRIDGDNRFSEQKLAGGFDPPAVLKRGYSAEAFLAGPLVEAMQTGGILFINELNRLPEGVQNVLLPAIDEGLITIPRLGVIRARPGFLVIATQNPREFVATSHLSEAILDRFELVWLDYQSEAEEIQIVSSRLAADQRERLAKASVRLVRRTRGLERVRRGASVRAALSLAEIAQALLQDGASFEEAFVLAARLALPTRIELERDAESGPQGVAELQAMLSEWAREIIAGLDGASGELKKKT